MNKVLIVDDSPAKYSALVSKLEGNLISGDDFVFVGCIRDGLAKLAEQHFDVLVLDMLLPETPWGEPIDDGGVRLLDHLEEDPDLKLPKYIIGITASRDHIDAVENAFQTKPWVLLKTAGGAPWEQRLIALIEHAISSEVAQDAEQYKTDVCLITALRHPEFEALTRTAIQFDEPVLVDRSTYVQKGTLKSNGALLSVVAGCCLRMGSTESALLAAKLIREFRPRIVALAGICAGYEEKVEFGDVIVANPCWDYTQSSKITATPDGVKTVANAPDYINIDEDIAAHFENLSRDRTFLAQLAEKWPGEKPRNPPQIFVAPSACGPAVIADASVFDDIRKHQNRTTIGLEMEAYGVYCAARKATRPTPLFFSAKAVCDYASYLKEDRYQKYAAHTSAGVAAEFLERYGYEICRSLP